MGSLTIAKDGNVFYTRAIGYNTAARLHDVATLAIDEASALNPVDTAMHVSSVTSTLPHRVPAG